MSNDVDWTNIAKPNIKSGYTNDDPKLCIKIKLVAKVVIKIIVPYLICYYYLSSFFYFFAFIREV